MNQAKEEEYINKIAMLELDNDKLRNALTMHIEGANLMIDALNISHMSRATASTIRSLITKLKGVEL